MKIPVKIIVRKFIQRNFLVPPLKHLVFPLLIHENVLQTYIFSTFCCLLVQTFTISKEKGKTCE